MVVYMLTTTDNPFNPFTQYDEWYRWDANEGYHTPSYLARVAKSSDELSEADQDRIIAEAMQEIVEYNVAGVYVIVSQEDLEGKREEVSVGGRGSLENDPPPVSPRS